MKVLQLTLKEFQVIKAAALKFTDTIYHNNLVEVVYESNPSNNEIIESLGFND